MKKLVIYISVILFAAVEKIVSEVAKEAVDKVNGAVNAVKLAAEAVRHHGDQLKKAMEDADVSVITVHISRVHLSLNPLETWKKYLDKIS